MERESLWRPNVEISPNCPRCGSSNTKFCYYNNYSLTQPRYFCKGCRRYWTKGGSLRNVPVGGGCRKSRRGKHLRVSNLDNNSKILSSNNNNNSSSMVDQSENSPQIDLALVYANFLNQNPRNKPISSPSPINDQFDHSLGFVTNGPKIMDYSSVLEDTLTLAHSSVLEDTLNLAQSHDNDLRCAFDDATVVHMSNNDLGVRVEECISNYGLPPLPDDHETLMWPSLGLIGNSDDASKMNGIEVEVQDEDEDGDGGNIEEHDPNMVFSDCWSPFDFSSEITFSRAYK